MIGHNALPVSGGASRVAGTSLSASASLRRDTQASKKTQSGYQAAFNASDYAVAMGTVGRYKCGMNLWWTNLLFTPSPGVPLVDARIDMLMQYYFKEPAPFPFDLVIAIPDRDFKPAEHKGALQSCTPEEVKIAYLRAIARDARQAGDGDVKPLATMMAWRHSVLTCTCEFKILETEEALYFEAFNLRERLITDVSALARTTYQRIHEIVLFKQRIGKVLGSTVTNKRLAEEFNKHAKLASASEEVTTEFVQHSLAIFERALKIPAVVAAIQELEAKCNVKSPFDSVHKLYGIVARAGTPEAIEWVFNSVADKVMSGAASAADFSVALLLGKKGTGAGSGRGLTDLYILKHNMLKHLLGPQADKLELPSDVRERLNHVLADHANYRVCLHPRAETTQAPDLTWRAGWPRSAIMFLSLIEGLVYGEDYDPALRVAVRSCKAPADVMEYDSISAKWAEVLEARKKEREEQTKAATASSGDADAAAGAESRMRDDESRACAAPPAAEGAGEETDRLQQEAERTVNSNILLVVEPESQTELKQKIMSSFFGKLSGQDHQRCPPPLLASRACRPSLPPLTTALEFFWIFSTSCPCDSLLPIIPAPCSPCRCWQWHHKGTLSWCTTSSKRRRAKRHRT